MLKEGIRRVRSTPKPNPGSSLGQPRRRILDSTLITDIAEATKGHLSVPFISATSSCATSSSKRPRVGSRQHSRNSSTPGERSMRNNDHFSTPVGAGIPVNSSTAHIHCSGPPSSKRPHVTKDCVYFI